MTEKNFGISRKRLDKLIEEATVDAYGEEEEHTGLLTMIEDNVVCPFRARVIGETVEVTSLEWTKPRPKGFEWIAAYLAWRENL